MGRSGVERNLVAFSFFYRFWAGRHVMALEGKDISIVSLSIDRI